MKLFNYATHRPQGKENCICFNSDGEKIPAYYHQKQECFYGRYGDHQNKKLHDVVQWKYAILHKRHSHEFEEANLQMLMQDGIEVFRTQFSCLPIDKQEKLFREFELLRQAIIERCKGEK